MAESPLQLLTQYKILQTLKTWLFFRMSLLRTIPPLRQHLYEALYAEETKACISTAASMAMIVLIQILHQE